MLYEEDGQTIEGSAVDLFCELLDTLILFAQRHALGAEAAPREYWGGHVLPNHFKVQFVQIRRVFFERV